MVWRVDPVIRYLMDTDTCVHILRRKPSVIERFRSIGITRIAISSITLAELYFGAYYSSRVQENLNQLGAFLTDPKPVLLPFDAKSANVFGQFKATLQSGGQLIPDMDLMIAAVAKQHGLTLVTGNLRHFQRLGSLQVESW